MPTTTSTMLRTWILSGHGNKGLYLLCWNFAKLCGVPGFWENVLDNFSCLYIAVADPGFSPGGCANSQNCYYFSNFCRKLHENERIWTPRSGASLAPPLDPPMHWDCLFRYSFCGPNTPSFLACRTISAKWAHPRLQGISGKGTEGSKQKTMQQK